MPNELTADGLTVKTNDEIVADLSVAMQTIFGADINVDQNSPDGQLINIFAQAQTDQLELLVATYNTFAVENAFGVTLDQRVALNGLVRRAGTHTITNVTVTTTGAVNLVGLDALVTDPTAIVYTVSDGNGVLYQLVSSVSIGGAGANVLVFQAAEIGGIQPAANTITNQVTVVAQVSAVNNPTVATTIGVAEETDAQLKIRHARSFYYGSTGPADAIEAALLNLPDVIDAFVAENTTSGSVNGVPARSIWTIVNGGTDAEIGTAIYAKKAPGCGMKGSTTYVVARPNGTTFTSKWDVALAEALTIEFTITPKIPNITFDATFLAAALAAALAYKLNQSATIGDIITAMNIIEPRGYLTVVGVSTDGGANYFDVVAPSDYQHYFTVAAADINVTLG